jgi:hypothetical protein
LSSSIRLFDPGGAGALGCEVGCMGLPPKAAGDSATGALSLLPDRESKSRRLLECVPWAVGGAEDCAGSAVEFACGSGWPAFWPESIGAIASICSLIALGSFPLLEESEYFGK